MAEDSASRTPSSSEMIAATAGLDTWKTWAGRKHGGAGFEFFDLFRGIGRIIKNSVPAASPPPGTVCPVCFSEPEEWHDMESCGHGVCLDCLRTYAATQVKDADHMGPLKCPVCPSPMRTKDAIRALDNNPEALSLWDARLRDKALLKMKGYRRCPNCSPPKIMAASEGDHQEYAPLVGGGFATAACLSERKSVKKPSSFVFELFRLTLTVMFIEVTSLMHTDWEKPVRMRSVLLTLFIAICVEMWLRYVVAWLERHGNNACKNNKEGRRLARFGAIPVSCPSCDTSFPLTTYVEDSSAPEDPSTQEASKQWKNDNTKPCPTCKAPIQKNGGCNAVRCSYCGLYMCWDCGQARDHGRCHGCAKRRILRFWAGQGP